MGCSPWAPRSEDPTVINHVIAFEVTQPVRPRYLNVTDGETDIRTGGRFTIATPRFALCASCGDKIKYI